MRQGGFKSRGFPALFVAMVAAYLLATTYPFKTFSNEAEIDITGIAFPAAGMVRSAGPLEWMREAIGAEAISVRLVVRAFETSQSGRILVLEDELSGPGHDLVVRQRGSHLIVHAYGSDSEYVVPDVFADGLAHEVVVDLHADSVSVAVDGAVMAFEHVPDRPWTRWGNDVHLALGNDLSWRRPWLGSISVVSIDVGSRVVDLIGSGILQAPRPASNAPAVFSTDLFDAFLNFVAFLPFGFLTAWGVQRPSAVIVGLIWLPISAAAELAQIFLIGRFPSVSDLVLNVGGAAGGGMLYKAVLELFNVSASKARSNVDDGSR